MADDTSKAPTLDFVTITVNIAAAYAYGNQFAASELPKLIIAVHGMLTGLARLQPQRAASATKEIERPTAGEIRKSITPDALISFLDGKPYKTLKRHLGIHGLNTQ